MNPRRGRICWKVISVEMSEIETETVMDIDPVYALPLSISGSQPQHEIEVIQVD